MPRKDKVGAESVAQQINGNLHRIYARTLAEDIPEQFQPLLQQLRDMDNAP